MPSSPPITDGLIAWLCSDTHVDVRPDNTVVSWGGAAAGMPSAAAIGSSRPLLVESSLNGYPVVRFDGAQGLFIESGLLATDSFHADRGRARHGCAC